MNFIHSLDGLDRPDGPDIITIITIHERMRMKPVHVVDVGKARTATGRIFICEIL